jgi:hypothetical protein
MAASSENKEAVEHVELHDGISHADVEKTSLSPEEDGTVTFKTKMAVLSLILMYEAYLFTLIMYDTFPGLSQSESSF